MSSGNVRLSPDKTWIPIGVAVGGIVSIVVGALWVNNSFQQLAFSNKEMAGAVKRVETTLDRLVTDGVQTRQMLQWIELARARNPNLSIPDLPR